MNNHFLPVETLAKTISTLEQQHRELEAKLEDYTRRLQREIDARKQAETKFERIFQASPYPIILVSLQDRRCVEVNAAFCHLFGYFREELIGRLTSEFAIYANPVEHDIVRQQLLATGSVRDLECTFRLQNDTVITILVSAEFIDIDGIPCFLAIGNNITDRKQVEEALRRSEERWQLVSAATQDAIWDVDFSLRKGFFSQRWYEMLGYTEQDFPGYGTDLFNLKDLIYAEDFDRVMAHVHSYMSHQIPHLAIEHRICCKDGSYKWIHVRGQAVWDEAGKPIRLVGSNTDITAQKQQEAQLLQSKQCLQRQQAALMELTNNKVFYNGDLTAALQTVTQTVAQALEINRVGIWFWNIEVGEIYLKDLYDRQSNRHSAGDTLYMKDYPCYFATLLQGEMVVASDVYQDPRTQEFREAWLLPNHITSMMDVPIHSDGTMIGIICVEHTHEQRQWTLEEQNFVNGVASMVSLAIEASDRKQAEEALRRSEERWQLAIDGSQDAIWDYDLTTGNIYFSPRCLLMTGYTTEELSNFEQWLELIHPDDFLASQLARKRHSNHETEYYECEYRLRRKDGHYIWVHPRGQARWDETGKAVRILGSVTDITEQKQREEALKLIVQGTASAIGDEFFCSLVKSLAQVMGVQYATVARFTDAQKTRARILAFWAGNQFEEPFEYDLVGTPCANVAQGRISHYPTNLQALFPHDPYLVPLQAESYWGAPLLNSKEEVVGMLAIVDRVPIPPNPSFESILQIFAARAGAELERKQFAEALQTANAEMQALFNAMDDLVVVRSVDGVCQKVLTPKASHLLYKPLEDMVGSTYADFPADSQEQILDCIQKATTTGQTAYIEYCLPIREKPIWFGACVSSINPESVVWVIRDITERKRIEEEMRYAKEVADSANRAKSEFLANMSHELRTPLTAILGLTEVLEGEVFGPLNAKQKSHVCTIAQSGKHLLDLINDLLDLAKIESGKMELQLTPTGVKSLCESSLVFVKEQAHQKHIQLQLDLDPDLHIMQVDERRMRQVLINLLSNAVKFTAAGGQVRLEVRGDRPNQIIHFQVIDTGIGIAPDQISRLFLPFVQLDSSFTRRYAGTGLGLALVRRLAELQGGSVSVKSQVDQGSCFTISLPWLTMEVPRQEPLCHDRSTAAFALCGRALSAHILLVEDNKAIILTLKDYLESQGCQVTIAHNGQEAIHKAQTISPDVIIMDVQMPGMDGIETTRRLRTEKRFTDLPIIILSSLVMSGDQERCLEAGATAYFPKPVSLQNLAQAIAEYCSTPLTKNRYSNQ